MCKSLVYRLLQSHRCIRHVRQSVHQFWLLSCLRLCIRNLSDRISQHWSRNGCNVCPYQQHGSVLRRWTTGQFASLYYYCIVLLLICRNTHLLLVFVYNKHANNSI